MYVQKGELVMKTKYVKIGYCDKNVFRLYWSGKDRNAQLVGPWVYKNPPQMECTNEFIEIKTTIEIVKKRLPGYHGRG